MFLEINTENYIFKRFEGHPTSVKGELMFIVFFIQQSLLPVTVLSIYTGFLREGTVRSAISCPGNPQPLEGRFSI